MHGQQNFKDKIMSFVVCERHEAALLWDFWQQRMVDSYRRFGTTYRSDLQTSSSARSSHVITLAKLRSTSWLAHIARNFN
jgi:hypothetical protein